ncbi:MAG: prepilin-type N-terminal cleavage/methylation domain [Pelosinus sp.]|nr:prepilin-type N-terminal cleavage/methylation domain [Pelosinus sp.]
MKLKKKNKGFSLVELIVVMAIMAILAVTLAPKLMQYVDKARQAQDRETVNSIYTAVKYGLMDSNLVPATTTTFKNFFN